MSKVKNLLLSSVVVAAASFTTAAQAGLLWGNNASATDVIEAFDPTTGAVVHQYSVGPGNGRGVVIVGNTGFYTQVGSGDIGEFNANTGAVLGSVIHTGHGGFASITFDGTDFWVGDYTGSNHAYRVDMAGNIVKTITLSLCGDHCDGLNFYLDHGMGRLISNRGDAAGGPYDVYDTDGNLITTALIHSGDSSGTGVAFNGTNFYVSNIFSNSVSIYDASGNFLSTMTLGLPLPSTGVGERLIEGLSFDYTVVLHQAPEPTTLALFGAGLVGLGAMRRRRKAKS